MKKLSTLSTHISNENKNNEISLYKGELTAKATAKGIVKLRMAFPKLDADFFQIFSEAIKRNNFTDERLEDAINYVIDTNIYPKPTIAQFINYDRKLKFFTYWEILNRVDKGDSFDNYQSVRIYEKQSKPLYCYVNDFENYNLEKWKK